MSEPFAADIESLLRQACAPVDPPETLATRLESTLQELTELAAEELESWELSAMRDPRNWVRPVVAVAVELAQRTMRAAADEVKRVIPKR
jgi:hypothetical protein